MSGDNMAGRELFAPRLASHRRTWSAAAVFLALVFIALGQVITVLPAIAAGWIDPEGINNAWGPLTFVLIASFGATAIFTLLWARFFERRGPATLGLNGGPALMRFLRGYGIGLLFLAITVGAVYLGGGYAIEAGGVFSAALTPMALLPIVALLFGFIIQGSTEELVFRGWLMQLIASRHGMLLAIVINTLLFMLAHGANIAPGRELAFGLINIGLYAIFMSLYAAKEGSLWGVCGVHAAWNWLLGVGFGLEVSGQLVQVTPLITDLKAVVSSPWWLTGGNFGPEASVVTTALLLVASLIVGLRGKFADFGGPANAEPMPMPVGAAKAEA